MAYKGDQIDKDWYTKLMFPTEETVLIAPQSHIYEGDCRWYKCNYEWAKVIGGFLRLLTLNTYWEGAETENNHGAEMIRTFLRGVRPVQPFPEQVGDCFSFLPSAPFVNYIPYDPYIGGSDYGVGFGAPPFLLGEYAQLAWLGIPYLETDITTPTDAFPQPTLWELPSFQFPTISISVVGSGQLEVTLLKVPLGGYVIEKIGGNPPNALDLLLGIILPDVAVIDLNLDLISFPTESGIEVGREIDIAAGVGVETTVWYTFVPAVDDSLFPIRYGGGFRSIGVCGFEGMGVVTGIENIRVNEQCELEYQQNGTWYGLDMSCFFDPLQSQITQNSDDIAVNAGNIANNTNLINQNAIAIANNTNLINQNAIDIGNLDIRVTALEEQPQGSTGGLFELIRHVELDSPANSVVIELTKEYTILKWAIIGNSTATGTTRANVSVIFNADTVLTNYRSGLTNYNSIGQMAGNSAFKEVCRGEIFNSDQQSPRAYEVAWGSWVNGGNYSEHEYQLCQYLPTDVLSSIEFQCLSYNFQTGTRFLLYGIPETDITNNSGQPFGQMLVDFDTYNSGYTLPVVQPCNLVPTIAPSGHGDGAYVSGTCYQYHSLFVEVELPVSARIDRVRFGTIWQSANEGAATNGLMNVQLLNSAHNVVYASEDFSETITPPTFNSFVQYDHAFAHNAVKYVLITSRLYHYDLSVSAALFIDDIIIDYTE